MKIIKIAIPVLAVLVAAFLWLAPIGPVPGLFIGGNATTVPDSWGDTASIHEISLKVSTGVLPRVMIVWVVQVEGDLHVVGASDGGWVSSLGQGGPVEIRVQDNTYALKANIVMDDWQPILEAYQNKYRPDYPDIGNGFPSIEDAAGAFAVFRLSAR